MLVLTRREGEAILVGDNIRISVEVVNGTQVKIGIEAPREINIVREELLGRPREPQPE